MEGSIDFRMQLRCQLLLAEIELNEKQVPFARQRLESIAEECNKNPQQMLHWKRLYKKLSPKAPPSLAQQWPKTNEDWQRYLTMNASIALAHIAYLEWLNQQNSPIAEVIAACRQIIQDFSLPYHQIHQLFAILKNREQHWDFIISTLFPFAHKNNPQPKVMWNIWWSACPISHRSKLEQSMRQQLITRPDFRLDEWLLNKFI